jgi:hypothetical protein
MTRVRGAAIKLLYEDEIRSVEGQEVKLLHDLLCTQ